MIVHYIAKICLYCIVLYCIVVSTNDLLLGRTYTELMYDDYLRNVTSEFKRKRQYHSLFTLNIYTVWRLTNVIFTVRREWRWDQYKIVINQFSHMYDQVEVHSLAIEHQVWLLHLSTIGLNTVQTPCWSKVSKHLSKISLFLEIR